MPASPRSRLLALLSCAALLTVVACGDDSDADTDGGSPPGREGGPRDAGPAGDAEPPPADAAGDGAADGGGDPGDAGDAEPPPPPPGDGGPRDSGPPGATVEITFEVEVPADTPDEPAVHLVGDFQGWDPADPAYALERGPDGLRTLTVTFDRDAPLAFKFARGDWSLVEKGLSGEEIPDRTLIASASGTHRFVVLAWADSRPAGGTTTGNVRTLTVPGFLGGRRVWVYLPPSYGDDTTARFPVLYMLDGQNVFDETTSFSGEWEVDETAERLIAAGEIEPLIVVAVDNGGGARMDEYTPWVDPGYGGGEADAHLAAIVEVLKPWVDARYRTRPGPESTGFSGSSLGGLMSVYTAYTRGDVFGRIGALSPSIWWSGARLVDYVGERPRPAGVRLWVDMGTMEGTSSIPDLRALRAALLADGFVEGDDLTVVEDPGAAHTESAWARRFPDVLRFLFPPG